MELVERRDHHWRLFSLIGLNENTIFSTNKKKKKMKHYRVETVELFSLVLVRYKNCLFQQEDFDLPNLRYAGGSTRFCRLNSWHH